METRVMLHITSYEEKNFCGWIYNGHFQKQVKFYDLCGMLNAMESLYDTLAFPQASFQLRHFKPGRRRPNKSKEAVNERTMEAAEKDRATFVVHVKFRQNATWQGTIQWVDTNKTQSFRSTLEMIRLIDEALDDGASMKISWED